MCVCVCVCARARALRILSMDKILHFIIPLINLLLTHTCTHAHTSKIIQVPVQS